MIIVYTDILIFLFLSFLISFIFFIASYILVPINYEKEKISAYECGFEPFSDARKKIDVRFYLVAILFIIFDIEIAYLFPYALDSGSLGTEGLLNVLFFFFILTGGLIFEWKKGALDWE